MTAPARHNAFLDTSTCEAAVRWDDLLTLQVDLFLEHEASHLSRLAAWRNARSIVDVGCGNGYYLAALAARNPDKALVGIDVSPDLIARARGRYATSRLDFAQRDFLRDGAPTSDLMLLRFVLQHLPDLAEVLRQAKRALRRGGAVVVIDPDFAASSCSPPAPLFMGMFAAFEEWRASLGLLRDGKLCLAERMRQFPEWRVAADDLIRVAQAPPFRNSLTAATFRAWIDLCQRAGGFDYPFNDVRAEIARWSERDAATSSVALRVTVLEPTAVG